MPGSNMKECVKQGWGEEGLDMYDIDENGVMRKLTQEEIAKIIKEEEEEEAKLVEKEVKHCEKKNCICNDSDYAYSSDGEEEEEELWLKRN